MEPMEEVYVRYANTVYRYLLSLTRSADIAEELTQETFCQAIRSSGRYDGSCAVSTWLCGIAKKVWQTYKRKHPRHAALDEADIAPQVGSAEDETLRTEAKMELMKSLHELPEPCREVMYLRAFGGLSFKEIGGILGWTENRARVTFYRGKEKLRKEFENDE